MNITNKSFQLPSPILIHYHHELPPTQIIYYTDCVFNPKKYTIPYHHQ